MIWYATNLLTNVYCTMFKLYAKRVTRNWARIFIASQMWIPSLLQVYLHKRKVLRWSPGFSIINDSSPSSTSAFNCSPMTPIPSTLTPLTPPQPYRDPRSSISAHYAISCISATSTSQTRFGSSPDVFDVSQTRSLVHFKPKNWHPISPDDRYNQKLVYASQF